jgi:hypothetical protein
MKTLDSTALPTIPLRPIFAPEAKIVAELSRKRGAQTRIFRRLDESSRDARLHPDDATIGITLLREPHGDRHAAC